MVKLLKKLSDYGSYLIRWPIPKGRDNHDKPQMCTSQRERVWGAKLVLNVTRQMLDRLIAMQQVKGAVVISLLSNKPYS
jgi:hypothetical protein